MIRRTRVWFVAAAAASFFSCGYHVGGKADLVPKSIQTISVPTFANFSKRYVLADMLPHYIAREFITRTRFRIEDNPAAADAVLNGTIGSVVALPAAVDPTSGKATSVRVIVTLSITLLERKTGHVLYSQPGLALAQNYDIAVDPHQFFDERAPAFDRLGRDLAHTIVSGVLENF